MRRLILAVYLCFFAFLFVPQVLADSVINFQADYLINQDGTILVKEKIIYDFTEPRHGIYRQIPYLKINQEGKQFKLDLIDFKVNYPFTTSIENNQIKLKIGEADKTLIGRQTYIIEYLIKGGLTYFSDHDELYWNVTGLEWEVPILSTQANIYLPKAVEDRQIKLQCFTGPKGSTQALCDQGFSQNQAQFQSQIPLSPGSGLTIVFGFPKDLVAVLEPVSYTPFWQTGLGKVIKTILAVSFLLAIVFWYLAYPVWIIIKWFRVGRDPKGIIGEASAWFSPPKIGKHELTPGEAGTLIDEKASFRELFGTIVDLARRGYFVIQERAKNDLYFIRRKNWSKDKNIQDYEKELLNSLFGSKTEIRIKGKKMLSAYSQLCESLYQTVVHLQLFPQNPSSIRIFYGVIAALAMSSANLFLLVVALIFGMAMPKKTALGVDTANMVKSLRNFLISQDRQLAFQAQKQLLFEKLLPYAIVFGVEKIWAKRFAEFDLKTPDWYESQTGTRFNTLVLANSLGRSFNTMTSSMTTTSSSSGFSSGFSGGSSGGGGGGGGGGSW